MPFLSRLKVGAKLALLMALAAVAMLAATGIGIVVLHTRMIDDRIDKLRAMVESTVAVARTLEGEVAAHRLTREQALAHLRSDVHAIRFDDGTGYVAVQGEDGMTLMHGTNPGLEGKPSPVVATGGRTIGDLTNDALRNADAAVISYRFAKPGQTEAVRSGNDERRRFERLQGNGAGACLRVPGQTATRVTINDLSRDGVALRYQGTLPAGSEVAIDLPGASGALTGRVVRAADGILAVAFAEDTATQARVDRAIATVTAARSAA